MSNDNNSFTTAKAIAKFLKLAGVNFIFGAPGTTELPLVAALDEVPEISYFTAFLDGVAVGIADGFARASGHIGVVNLHAAQGTLNALGYIRAAYRDNSPVVVIAGAPSLSYSINEPNHFQRGLVDTVSRVCKWSWMVTHPDEAVPAVRRAIEIALSFPLGPTYVAVPQDVLVSPIQLPYFDKPYSHVSWEFRANREYVKIAARMLAQAHHPLIFAGNTVGRFNSVEPLVKLAEKLGAPVVSEALDRGPQIQAVNFPSNHDLFLGFFDIRDQVIRNALANCDVLLQVGARATYPRVIGHLSPNTYVIQMALDPTEIAQNQSAALGLIGHIGTVLEELLNELTVTPLQKHTRKSTLGSIELAGTRRAELSRQVSSISLAGSPITGLQLVKAMGECFEPSTIIVDDSQCFGGFLKAVYPFTYPSTLFGSMASHIGWGLPAAIGVQLAFREQRVICTVSDGSFLFSLQSLGTMAKYHIPVVVLVINNRGFMSLNLEISRYITAQKTNRDCLSLTNPEFDYSAMARGLGVRSLRVSQAEDLVKTLQASLESREPTLVDVVMSTHPEDWTLGWYIAPPK